MTKRADKWPIWLMMTSSGDDNWSSGSLGLLTDKTKKKKNKPKAEQETAQPTAARFGLKKKINQRQSKKLPSLRLRGLKKNPKAEQETAQPMAARFKKN